MSLFRTKVGKLANKTFQPYSSKPFSRRNVHNTSDASEDVRAQYQIMVIVVRVLMKRKLDEVNSHLAKK